MKFNLLKPGLYTYWILVGIVLLATASCNKNDHPANNPAPTAVDKDSVSFIVLGDWGIAGAEAQKDVAAQMDVYAKKHNVQLIIASGDNFYPAGVSGTGDAHWKVSFEDIYNKPTHQVPWYPVLGNHDYGSNPEAEIAYSSLSPRWKMPARYYMVTKNIDASHSVLFTFTDTSPFVTGYYGGGYADLKLQDTAAQLTWLRNTLTSSTATWKIVIGHHPVYSAGSHGNTPELIARFKPLFLQTQTNFYICGHEHNLQALGVPNEQVHYLISGGGGYLSSYPVSPNAYAVFSKPSAGFMVMTLYTGKANIYFYDEKGVLLYQEEVKK